MKRGKYEKKELIKKLKEKKELAGIADSFVEEILDNYLKKYKISLEKLAPSQIKVLVKEIRADLRSFVGQYQKTTKDKAKLFNLKNKSGLLKTHSSTSERAAIYPELKKIISKLKISSILDLGCGLNPIALASRKIEYYASDIKEDELLLIKKYFQKNKIKGETFVYNLRKIEPGLPYADLCLILKVLDILEKNRGARSNLTEKILENVQCKYFIVSFSTKKLSGKPMNRPDRVWFEKILAKRELKFQKFTFGNEIFYLIVTQRR